MRGVTLTQPWATLVACGAKVIETRPKRSIYRGPLAIHAAQGFQGLYGRTADMLIDQQANREPYQSVLVAAGYGYVEPKGVENMVDTARLPRGQIVAVASLIDVMPTEQARSLIRRGVEGCEHEAVFGDYTAGRFAWLLEDVRRLTEPLEFRGNQTLFNVPEDVAREVQSRAATPDRKDRHPWT